jgi:hypothetical protein
MAGVDKIYVNNWKDFCEVRDYFLNTEYVANNGTKCVLKNYMYDVEDVSEDFFDGEREVAITNTPCKVDYYLAMYCPVKAVQEYLESVYEDYKNLDEWKEYITFDRNPGNKIKVIKYPKFGKINKALNQRFGWHVSVITPDGDGYKSYPTYYGDTNQWIYDYELEFPIDKSCGWCNYKTIKSLIRNIRKWKLPKGSIVTAQGRYIGECYKFLIK